MSSHTPLTIDQARVRINAAIVLPILGLVAAALVGVFVSSSIIAHPPQGWDPLGLLLLGIAALAGAANLIAQLLLRQAGSFTSEKTGAPLKAMRGAHGVVLGFHIEWIVLNSLFLFFLIAQLGLSDRMGGQPVAITVSRLIAAVVFAFGIGAVNVIYILLRSRTRVRI